MTTVYDELGRTKEVIDAEASTVTTYTTTTYPPYGTVRKIAVTDKENRVTTQILDPLGRVIEIQATQSNHGFGGRPVNGPYIHPVRPTDVVTDPLGKETYYGYDAFNRVNVVGEKMQNESLGALVQIAAYDYYDDGTLWKSTDRDGTTTTFHYDHLNAAPRVRRPTAASMSLPSGDITRSGIWIG